MMQPGVGHPGKAEGHAEIGGRILLFGKLLPAPHPASTLLLQAKGEKQFDRAVTGRSKLIFSSQSSSNPCEVFR
jgi:hypothetical protein